MNNAVLLETNVTSVTLVARQPTSVTLVARQPTLVARQQCQIACEVQEGLKCWELSQMPSGHEDYQFIH